MTSVSNIDEAIFPIKKVKLPNWQLHRPRSKGCLAQLTGRAFI